MPPRPDAPVWGHDHDLCHEIVCGQHILKMGQGQPNAGTTVPPIITTKLKHGRTPDALIRVAFNQEDTLGLTNSTFSYLGHLGQH